MIESGTLAAQLASRLLGLRYPEQDSLTAFKQGMYRRYQHARHLQALDEHLEAVTQYVETGEGIARLIVAMPPRHGKSLTVSRLYPAWHLGRNPRQRLMLVSYGQSLANKNSRFVRNLLRGKDYARIFPWTRLAPDSQSVMAWDIAGSMGEAGMDALGIGGGATGKGAHVLIIDDPIKNRAEAESQLYRNRIWDAWIDDLSTRLEPGAAVVLVATRWHEDDLSGRLLKQGGWHLLRMPALAEETDPLGREVGAALWPERYSEQSLGEQRDNAGPYSWNSIWQQRPQAAEGGIFKRGWFRPYLRVIPETVAAVRYWDLAMSERTSADWTVGVRMEMDRNGEVYITDVARERRELPHLPRFLADVMLSDGPEVKQGFEDKGYMTRAIKALVKEPRLANFVIKGYPAEQDKLTRALPFAARAALELVHVRDAAWADAYVDELASFPTGGHDDQVDASAGAWVMLNETKRKVDSRVQRWA